MIHIQTQNFYERFTGVKHEITIMFDYIGRKVYEVRVDGEYYSSHESKGEAFDEVVDIIKLYNWRSVRMV